jgi:hypothetical protein
MFMAFYYIKILDTALSGGTGPTFIVLFLVYKLD